MALLGLSSHDQFGWLKPLRGWIKHWNAIAWRRRKLGRDWLLARLATLKRASRRHVTFIGVTGSCGKTTTTTLIGAILSAVGKCRLGADKNGHRRALEAVLSVDASTQFCVQELGGMQLEAALRNFSPQIGVITTIGSDHRKVFRSLDGAAQVKGRLVERLPETGTAILNADDQLVNALASRTRARVVTFGASPGADIRATAVSSAWPERLALTVTYRGEQVRIETRLVGEHWVTSVLAAVSCGLACGVDLRTCANAVATVEPIFGRYSVHGNPEGITYILDTQKAPRWTLGSGITFVKNARTPHKTIIFGTISDYHGDSGRHYRQVAREALEVADRVLFVGPQSVRVEKLRKGDLQNRLLVFPTAYQATAFLENESPPGCLVYIKGSIRADHLERIMLAQMDRVVCWRERCGRKKPCPACRLYRTPSIPPLCATGDEGTLRLPRRRDASAA